MKTAKKYIPSEIEKKWQETWRREKTYEFKYSNSDKKYYTLVELPYPSGDLHIGHWFTFVAPDVLSRFKRMKGYDVFFPHGYDAFGLPAENAAIKRKVHPKDWTMSNIETMTAQFRTMGSIMDLDGATITCLPEYYKWNQWIFQKMFENGLAYRGKVLSNWCEFDKTVLANEHVENGKCWRCGNEVVQKEVEQWFLKITDYADLLLWPQQPSVDWPLSVRVGQNAWIGKSEGITVNFKLENGEDFEVFTTRLDTIFGVTFLVIAPEIVDLKRHVSPGQKKVVEAYIKEAEKKTELTRKENKEKTGVFSGMYGIHPITKERIPVWIADYVLGNYGTGKIMAVPAHDDRDYDFATKFDIPIKQVIEGKGSDKLPYASYGTLINSGTFNGLSSEQAKLAIADPKTNGGVPFPQPVSMYHIRDWSISRQRYWGTPVPMIHCTACGVVPVPKSQLPVELPYEVDYMPQGKPPLASNEEWLKVSCPQCSGEATRDAETLDTFFDSSWYFFRYVNNTYSEGPFDTKKVAKVMPVDIYFGGAEHTLGHTLYARFFTKFFKDIGLISFDEFATKRIQHGIVLGPDGNKMSKSKGNVINPDDVVKEYGADAVRLYLNFMMPYEATAPWSTEAIAGVFRFLQRVWQLKDRISSDKKQTADDSFQMNETIRKVERDLEQIKNNTAIAFIMTWLNYLSKQDTITNQEYKTLLLLLAPFAPHITEELWMAIGEKFSIHNQAWPEAQEGSITASSVKIPVQVNGKVRGVLQVPSDALDQASVLGLAQKDASISKHIEGKNFNVIYIKGKILNLVV